MGSRPARPPGATAGPVLTAALCPPPAGPSCNLIRAWDSGRARAVHQGGCSDPPPWYGGAERSGAERRSRLARPGLPAAVPAARPRRPGPANGAGGGRCRGCSARPAPPGPAPNRPRTGPSRARHRHRPRAPRRCGRTGSAARPRYTTRNPQPPTPGQGRHGSARLPSSSTHSTVLCPFFWQPENKPGKVGRCLTEQGTGQTSCFAVSTTGPVRNGARLHSRWETRIMMPFVSKALHFSEYSVTRKDMFYPRAELQTALHSAWQPSNDIKTYQRHLNRRGGKKKKAINSKRWLAIVTRVKSKHLGNGPQRMSD